MSFNFFFLITSSPFYFVQGYQLQQLIEEVPNVELMIAIDYYYYYYYDLVLVNHVLAILFFLFL